KTAFETVSSLVIMGEKLIQHITSIVKMYKEEVTIIKDLARVPTILRRQTMHRAGATSHSTAFVVSVCLRSYAVDHNGFEHIIQFAAENWWISDMYSFTKNEPSELNIDALLDTEVLLLNRSCQLSIFDRIPKMERYF